MVWITHETTASPRIIQQLRREDSIKTELYFNGAALLSNHCYGVLYIYSRLILNKGN